MNILNVINALNEKNEFVISEICMVENKLCRTEDIVLKLVKDKNNKIDLLFIINGNSTSCADKKKFYSLFVCLEKEERVTIMFDLVKKIGQYNILKILKEYSSEDLHDYFKELSDLFIIKSDFLYSNEVLKEIPDDRLSDINVLIEVTRYMNGEFE